MTDEMLSAQADAADEISNSIILSINHAIIRHGRDPQTREILMSAMMMAVKTLDVAIPGFRRLLIKMLQWAEDKDKEK